MRHHSKFSRIGCLAIVALALPHAGRAQGAGNTLGFSADRLARIDRFMQQYADSNRIGGAVGMVLRDGKVV